MLKITAPGIYRDISEADYRADPCPEPSLTQSICKVLLDHSPLHAMFEHPRLAPPDQDEEAEKYFKAMAIGNACHKALLGRGKEIVVIQADDFRTKAARAKRDEATGKGQVPILEGHMADVEVMLNAARVQLLNHEDSDAFSNGSGEVMLAWTEDGVWYRALVDWLTFDMLTVDDFKSTGMSVAPHVLGMRAENAGWPIQAAFIERGLDFLHPQSAGRRRFRFVAQENYRPYELVVAHMDEHWMTMGRKKVAAADRLWRAAITTGKWPGYGRRAIVPEYPAWAENRWLEREEIEFSENNPKLIMAG